MIIEPASEGRTLRTEQLSADLVVIGGGLGGTCAAITAAREGLKTILVQDRPVLGGNASSEVRLWVLGATSHMGNNNRWAREGGVMNEILEENLYRNRQGNAIIFDTILLEKCLLEENLTLLLNTAAFEVEKSAQGNGDTISAVHAFCSQNSTRYHLSAPYFCDASGDGIVGFMAGAAFRMGAESKEEFGEGFAPDASYGELLGHSLYFYTKDTGTPVNFTAPSWALKDITKIPRYRQFNTNMQGCNFWWIEYGGRLDTVHETETIKWELWKVVYGVWDHIKNSGEFPDAETLTLEWVGHIPGKRESRRFEGDYMIRQQDVIDQTHFKDAVAHGGWAIDLHPADGVYSEKPGCTQWHSKGTYGIPYRCYYSQNINNLFLAGRIISATHVAFGSTRVMATCGAGGQAVGTAAALCKKHHCSPRDLSSGEKLTELQTRLQRSGQFLPGIADEDSADLARQANISVSSSLELATLKGDDDWLPLEHAQAMLLPLASGPCPDFTLDLKTDTDATLLVSLCRAEKPGNFTMDECLQELELELKAGSSQVPISFQTEITRAGYHFLKISEHPAVQVRLSSQRLSGILAVSSSFNKAVATTNKQSPTEDIGVESFEFWLPQRRPKGKNIALTIEPPLSPFGPENLVTGPARPTDQPNAWIADPADQQAKVELNWQQPVSLQHICLEFDPDWDHPIESVLMTHPEEVSPFMVKDFDLIDASGNTLAAVRDHHSGHFSLDLPEAITTTSLTLQILATHGNPAALFRMRVY